MQRSNCYDFWNRWKTDGKNTKEVKMKPSILPEADAARKPHFIDPESPGNETDGVEDAFIDKEESEEDGDDLIEC